MKSTKKTKYYKILNDRFLEFSLFPKISEIDNKTTYLLVKRHSTAFDAKLIENYCIDLKNYLSKEERRAIKSVFFYSFEKEISFRFYKSTGKQSVSFLFKNSKLERVL